ncbi:uncharacterized protein LOC123516323 isoform X2 [Portunus trituberculatus]|uniref:uncharacterized protein LOC123516323 isoform X2 n=1 Tax=Portunus trituberculatus TaxID=210409 RepID=UPI001E1CC621|nr:uncharacterized protein LOC123516323 isoform X2 [Portunus trituberculatus]
MWPSSLLMTVVILAVMIPTPTISLSMPAECKVASSFNIASTINSQTTIWGFIKNAEVGTFLKVNYYAEDTLAYKTTTCNHTHVTTVINNKRDNEESSTAVSWPVCSAWHQFLLEVQQETLTITDDRNNTWINTKFKSSTARLEVFMDYFRNSCITLTPVREVERGVPLHIAAPQGSDALHLTLAGKSNTQLQVTVGNVNLPLGQLFSSQPYHRLNVKSIHGASPAVVYEGVWETVVDVGCDLSTFSLVSADGNFTLMQHSDLLLHCYKELPTINPDHLCYYSLTLVLLWVAAVGNIIVHFSLRRFFRQQHELSTTTIGPGNLLTENHLAGESFLQRPASHPHNSTYPDCSDAVYDEIDDTLSRRQAHQ